MREGRHTIDCKLWGKYSIAEHGTAKPSRKTPQTEPFRLIQVSIREQQQIIKFKNVIADTVWTIQWNIQ